MYNLTRARMDYLSFALGVGCAILLEFGGVIGFVTRSVWRQAGAINIAWPQSVWTMPSLGIIALITAATIVVGVLVAAWWSWSKRGKPRVEQPDVFVMSSPSIATAYDDDQAAKTRAQLERQLNDLLKLVVGYLERNSAYSAAVVRVQDQLTSNVSVEQVRRLVEMLISQNAQALRDASDLRGQLEDAREQTSDIQQRLHKAEQLTRIDALTSIANRRSLEEFLEREIAKSHEDQSPLCVVMTDIDHFKQVNDSYGHQMGDDVLKSFARLLQSSARPSDLVARYGGEEFTLILPRTPMGNAYQLTDSVRCILDSSAMNGVESDKPLAKVTASFGIAEIREDERAAQLLFRADRMLFEAKKKGRNLVVTDSHDRPAQDRSHRSGSASGSTTMAALDGRPSQ